MDKEIEFCVWTRDENQECNIWHSDCGNVFIFHVDTPTANCFRFCPYCDKPLKEAEDEKLFGS